MPKSREKLYYSISEVAEVADVKAHVLRYWETQFKLLRPRKNRAGNRMYRPRDLNLVLTIRDLLYRNGYTTAGARRKLLDARRRGELDNGLLTDDTQEPDVDVPAPRASARTNGEVRAEHDDAKEPSQPNVSVPPVDDSQLTLADAARARHLRDVRRELEALLAVLDTPGGQTTH